MISERNPRPPKATPDLPATFAAAEDAQITEAVDHWFGLIVKVLGSDGREARHRQHGSRVTNKSTDKFPSFNSMRGI
jgi:hypothetical protein